MNTSEAPINNPRTSYYAPEPGGGPCTNCGKSFGLHAPITMACPPADPVPAHTGGHRTLTEREFHILIDRLAQGIRDKNAVAQTMGGATYYVVNMGEVAENARAILALMTNHWAYTVPALAPSWEAPCPCQENPE